jgi:hypothetical protein
MNLPPTLLYFRNTAQAGSRRFLTVEGRVCTQATPGGTRDGQSATGTSVPQSSSVFPCQHHVTAAP